MFDHRIAEIVGRGCAIDPLGFPSQRVETTGQCDKKSAVDRHNDGGISRGMMSRGTVGRRRRGHRRKGANTSEDNDERSETRGTVNACA
jgi:hypothetical protein